MRLIPTASVAYPRMLGHGPEAAAHPPDLLQPHESLCRDDQPAFGLLGERVDGGDLIEPRYGGEPRRRLDRRGPALSQGEQQRGREDAEACVWQTVGTGDGGQAALDLIDRLSDRAERGAQAREKGLDLVLGPLVGCRGRARPTKAPSEFVGAGLDDSAGGLGHVIPGAGGRRRARPAVQALVDQRTVAPHHQLFEPDRRSRIREPTHLPTSFPTTGVLDKSVTAALRPEAPA